MIAIIVTIQLKPGFRDRFVEAMLEDARGSVSDEPGCYGFDIMQNDSDPNRYHLFEVYADQAALEAHRKTPHFLKWLSTVEEWFYGDIQLIPCNTVFPSDDGWRSQKPHLAQ